MRSGLLSTKACASSLRLRLLQPEREPLDHLVDTWTNRPLAILALVGLVLLVGLITRVGAVDRVGFLRHWEALVGLGLLLTLGLRGG